MQQQNQNVKKKSFIENFIRNVKIQPLKRKKTIILFEFWIFCLKIIKNNYD